MALNKIFSSKNVATILKGGKEVALAGATETSLWKRPEMAIDASIPGFTRAVEKRQEPLPVGTARIIMRFVLDSNKAEFQ